MVPECRPVEDADLLEQDEPVELLGSPEEAEDAHHPEGVQDADHPEVVETLVVLRPAPGDLATSEGRPPREEGLREPYAALLDRT